ncbi:MAG: acetyltransferase [Anaerolineae bacterium]|jgi:hypothetical protein
MTDKTLDTWAIVELFGHSKIAGRVTEQQIAGGAFLRVDVPGVDGQQEFTRFYGAGAIYSITPVSEEMARRTVEVINPRPVTVYGVVLPERQLSAPEPEDVEVWPPDDDELHEEPE